MGLVPNLALEQQGGKRLHRETTEKDVLDLIECMEVGG